MVGDAVGDDALAPSGGDAQEVAARAPASVVGAGPVAHGTAMARELADAFRGHVQRALGRLSANRTMVGLDDAETSLAFVDHYLSTVRSETRAPILALIAAEAGAYYGELVCRALGGTWIGEGKDPRRLRVLMRDQFLYFSPVDQAFEVLLGRDAPDGDDDSQVDDETPSISGLDTEFHARRRRRPRPQRDGEAPTQGEPPDDATWLAERLAERPPIARTEYYSLTCRFETLKLVLELLATKHLDEGRTPREYHVADYVEALADGG